MPGASRTGAAFLACLLLWLTAAGGAWAQLLDEDLLIQADSLHYDEVHGIVTARGNVELAHQGRILKADSVSYHQPEDLMTASGNVILLEPDGETLFAEYVELTGDLREGALFGLYALLTDGSRIAAAGALRFAGRVTEMSKAVYSPCELCPDDPDAPPLWQIKARRVVHDQLMRDISYHDATLELFGVPILYTPYFSHPDPTVDRRSGFLTPSYGSDTNLGVTLQVPYYFNLAPNRDATFAPIFTTEAGVVGVGEYRAMTTTGSYEIAGSITKSDVGLPRREDPKLRWHIKSEGLWHYDRTWQYGFDVYRSSDDTYLRRYNFDNPNTLTSSAFVEGFRNRSYASAFAYSFQGLRQSDDSDEIPLVAPLLEYQIVTPPDQHGAFLMLDANVLSLTRDEGTDANRVIASAAWERPFLTPGGHIFTFRTSLRGDAYQVNDHKITGKPGTFSGFVGRLVPQASLQWNWPLVRQAGNTQQLIEPIVMAVLSPNIGDDQRIPNEDSQEFEFDEINLFSANRFPGYDRVEGGPRVNYGIRLGVYGSHGGRSELLFGQVYRAHVDNTFGPQTGLDDHFSDYVGRVLVSPASYFDMIYRFRLDKDDFDLRRSELGLGVGPDWLRLNTTYVRLSDPPDDVVDTVGAREQVNFVGIAQLYDEWTFRAEWRRDLTGGGTIRYGGQVTYEDECIELGLRVVRRFTRDRNIDPDTLYLFTIRLKTLG